MSLVGIDDVEWGIKTKSQYTLQMTKDDKLKKPPMETDFTNVESNK